MKWASEPTNSRWAEINPSNNQWAQIKLFQMECEPKLKGEWKAPETQLLLHQLNKKLHNVLKWELKLEILLMMWSTLNKVTTTPRKKIMPNLQLKSSALEPNVFLYKK
jgi:hypothetical protein